MKPSTQGSYPFLEANFLDFSRIQISFYRTPKFTFTFLLAKISMLILLTVSHAFHIFSLGWKMPEKNYRTF